MTGDRAWFWWAGRDEEWMTVGPCNTREDAVTEAIHDIGQGKGDFIVLEATMADLSLSASTILDNAYEHWSDDSEYFSSEGDAPEPQGSKEDQASAETELQALLDAWLAKWLHIFPKPNMFFAERNREVIANTVDPDMLPGGHDNPRDRWSEDR